MTSNPKYQGVGETRTRIGERNRSGMLIRTYVEEVEGIYYREGIIEREGLAKGTNDPDK